MYKPFVTGAIFLTAAALVSGCSGGSGSDSSTGGGGTKMALVVGSQADVYYRSLECGAKTEAKKLGVDLTVQGPKTFDTTQQTTVLQGVVARQPKAIMIAPTDSKALFTPLKQAKQSGTKIITVDTQLADESIVSSAVTADWHAVGTTGADEVNKLTGGKGTVLAIFSPPGVSTSDLGRVAFQAQMKKYPGIKLLPIQFSEGETGKSASIVSATLARYPDLSAVYTYNGNDLEGVASSLKEAGKSESVATLSGDAQPFQVQLLKNGGVSALILVKPYDIGVQAVQQAVKAVEGDPTTKLIKVGDLVATKARMNDKSVSTYFYKAC